VNAYASAPALEERDLQRPLPDRFVLTLPAAGIRRPAGWERL
jgi:hypothetical protein